MNASPPSKPSPPTAPLQRCAQGIAEDSDTQALATRASVMLPAHLLDPSEIIILLLKPSPWFIVLGPFKTLVALAMTTAIAVMIAGHFFLGAYQTETALVGLAVIALRLFWQFLEWLSRAYVLTDRRIVQVEGVMRVRVYEAPLEKIQQTQVIRSLREQLTGLGTLGFATAGTGFTDAFWVMLARPLEIHQKVVQTLDRYRR